MASPAPPPKLNKLRVFLVIFAFLVFVSSVVLFSLLGHDIFTIPYLTPFAHFLGKIISPFLPFLAPLTFGTFLKVCQHETFPGKKSWCFITGGYCFTHMQRACKDVARLYVGRGENGIVELCGLNECRSDWVETGLLVLVVVGQWRGWRWDFGLVEKWVEETVNQAKAQDEEKRRKILGEDVESGVDDKVDEKKELVGGEEVGGDMEKTGLLVEVEEKAGGKA
jgi:hypothetical protein